MRNVKWRKFLAQSTSLVWIIAVVGQRGRRGGFSSGFGDFGDFSNFSQQGTCRGQSCHKEPQKEESLDIIQNVVLNLILCIHLIDFIKYTKLWINWVIKENLRYEEIMKLFHIIFKWCPYPFTHDQLNWWQGF